MHHMKYGYTVALPENFGLDAAKRVIEARGYKWIQRIPKEKHLLGDKEKIQLAEEIWLLPNGRGVVRYIYDDVVEVPCINAGSDIPYEAPKILKDLAADLPLFRIEDLIEPALASEWRPYALRALSSITEGFHSDVVNAFIIALKDPEPNMRRYALACIGRYPAFVFVKELEQQALTEEHPDIKQWELGLAASIRNLGEFGVW